VERPPPLEWCKKLGVNNLQKKNRFAVVICPHPHTFQLKTSHGKNLAVVKGGTREPKLEQGKKKRPHHVFKLWKGSGVHRGKKKGNGWKTLAPWWFFLGRGLSKSGGGKGGRFEKVVGAPLPPHRFYTVNQEKEKPPVAVRGEGGMNGGPQTKKKNKGGSNVFQKPP